MMANLLHELGQWLGSLDRPFAFLLALPFLVALAAFARGCFDRYRKGHP